MGHITMINPVFDFLMGVAHLLKTNTFHLINERPITNMASLEHCRNINTFACVGQACMISASYARLSLLPSYIIIFCMHCPHRGSTSN